VAAVLGFAFFSMEMVWYRMLAPILGGSTYTFGMILAIALSGIVIGSWVYASLKSRLKPGLSLLSLTCSLEAFFLAVPFWLGDSLALFVTALKSLDVYGFPGIVGSWFFILLIVIFPAAGAAGFSFPLLIAMRGQGARDVGQQTGMVYAWNTVGSILGALITAVFLLPFLSAPGCWKAVVALLVAVSLVALLPILRRRSYVLLKLALFIMPVLSVMLLLGEGPTAFWRHSGIGAGKLNLIGSDSNSIQKKINNKRSTVVWEKDGRESGVALVRFNGLSFVINGKSDGNSWYDGPTQVMAGMVAAILHPKPQRAMVIGLGTGSSGGWLGSIPTMQQVDVVELEPAIIEVARACGPVNNYVLDNPKVNIIIGDGRETLLTSKEEYDLIFSEPSNPYRVGISSLYTREFYQAVVERLSPQGYFSQWVQGYHMDSQTIRTIIATLGETFPSVEIWQSATDDLLFVCSLEKKSYSVDQLRQRIAEEPFEVHCLMFGV
jgi:spermidine synthase